MSIKVSNEPPSDMKSNMRRAFAAFTPEAEDRLSTATKRTAYKSILFGLCFYHSLLLGRKKFGTGIALWAMGQVFARRRGVMEEALAAHGLGVAGRGVFGGAHSCAERWPCWPRPWVASVGASARERLGPRVGAS